MSEIRTVNSVRNPLWVLAICWALAGLIVLAHIRVETLRLPSIRQEGKWYLADPDDYMRLHRVKQILSGRTRVVRHIQEMNYPDGVTLHWTAPMDYLLATAAWVFGGGDPVGALEGVGAWTPVALGAIVLVVMMAMVRRAVGWGPALIAGLMLAISRGFHLVFKLGHADHHALIELFMLLAISGWIPRRQSPDDASEPTRAGAMLSGVCMGMAWWVSAQAIVAWAAIVAGATLATFHASADRRMVWVDRRRRFSIALLIVLLAAVLIENWPAVWRPMLDSVSSLQIGLALVGLLLPYGKMAPQQRTARQWAVFLGAVSVLIIWLAVNRPAMTVIFSRPEFYWWSSVVTELQPLYLTATGDWSIGPFLNYLGYLPFVLPVALWFLVRSHAVSCAVKTIFVLLSVGVTILAFLQLRWVYHVNLGLVPVTAIGLHALCKRLYARRSTVADIVRFAMLLVIVMVLTWRSTTELISTRMAARPMPFVQRAMHAAEAISRLAATDKNLLGKTIMCAPEEGPLLLYRTGLPVVAGPYHRALEGYLEVCRFFAETDPRAARAQLERLGVGYIVVPSDGPLALRVMERTLYGEMRSFEPPQRKLEDGELFESVTPLANMERTMVYHLENVTPPAELGVEPVANLQRSMGGETEVVGFLYAVRPR